MPSDGADEKARAATLAPRAAQIVTMLEHAPARGEKIPSVTEVTTC